MAKTKAGRVLAAKYRLGNWTVINQVDLTDPRVQAIARKGGALFLWLFILTYTTGNANGFAVSAERLIEASGFSRAAVFRGLAHLQAAGLLERSNRPGRSNRYEVIQPFNEAVASLTSETEGGITSETGGSHFCDGGSLTSATRSEKQKNSSGFCSVTITKSQKRDTQDRDRHWDGLSADDKRRCIQSAEAQLADTRDLFMQDGDQESPIWRECVMDAAKEIASSV